MVDASSAPIPEDASSAPDASSTFAPDAVEGSSTNTPSLVVAFETHAEIAREKALNPSTTTFHILLDVSVDQITPVEVEILKRYVLDTLVKELGATTPISSVRLDIYAGSTILRVSITG